MLGDDALQSVAALLFGTLIVLTAGIVLDVPGAARAGIAVVMLGAILMGADYAIDRSSSVETVGSALLIGGGVAGALIAVAGGNPFERWVAVVPLVAGLVLVYASDDDATLPIGGSVLAADSSE